MKHGMMKKMNNTKVNVLSIMKLMDNGKVAHTIKIENVLSYNFIFDSKKLATLNVVTNNLSMDDLNKLFTKPYESYVLLGVKRIKINGDEKTFDIPPRVFKHALIKEDGKTIDMTFYETLGESND